jgi:hypothetical protein
VNIICELGSNLFVIKHESCRGELVAWTNETSTQGLLCGVDMVFANDTCIVIKKMPDDDPTEKYFLVKFKSTRIYHEDFISIGKFEAEQLMQNMKLKYANSHCE